MNNTLQKIKLSGNLIGEDGGRAIMRAVMGDTCHCQIDCSGCSYPLVEEAFDPQVPCKTSPYNLRFSSPYDRAVLEELFQMVRMGLGSMRQVQRGEEDEERKQVRPASGSSTGSGGDGGKKGAKGKGGKQVAATPSRSKAVPKGTRLHHEQDMTSNQLGMLGSKGATLPVSGKVSGLLIDLTDLCKY
jgi:hypothetical protein